QETRMQGPVVPADDVVVAAQYNMRPEIARQLVVGLEQGADESLLALGLVGAAITAGDVYADHRDGRLGAQHGGGYPARDADGGELGRQVPYHADTANQGAAALAVGVGGLDDRETRAAEPVEQPGGAGPGAGLGDHEHFFGPPGEPVEQQAGAFRRGCA